MTDARVPYHEASMRGEVIRAVPEIREFRQRAVHSVPEKLREGLWLEFGTWLGGSAHDIAEAMPTVAMPDVDGKPSEPLRHVLHCFDSWEGLPEDWGDSHPAGTFSTAGRIPKLPWNAQAHKGWFTETLHDLLDESPREHWPAAFVHIDCDLYESARFVIATLRDAGRLVSGTVVMFDELWGHVGWQGDEYRVLRDELMPYFDCELVAVAPDLKRAAFRLQLRDEGRGMRDEQKENHRDTESTEGETGNGN